jgi:hypothetical protein
MTDRELERRLRHWYGDAVGEQETAPIELRRRIAAIPIAPPAPLRRRSRRGPLTLLAVAALLLVSGAMTAGSGVMRLTTPPAPSPSLAGGGWTSLDLQRLQDGPPTDGFVVSWSGGELALWESGDPQQTEFGGLTGAGPLYAWVSRDSVRWVRVPPSAFSPVVVAYAVATMGSSVVVLTETSDYTSTAWLSADGTTWTSERAPLWRFSDRAFGNAQVTWDNRVAGGPNGIVAIGGQRQDVVGASNVVYFSADARVWQSATLPGEGASVAGVEAFGSGFVAVGSTESSQIHPAAWRSDDGLHWTQTLDGTARPGEAFLHVEAGRGGLIANSWSGPFNKIRSWWTSPDGRSWTIGTDPLGGATGDNGPYEGDGTRLLWSTYQVPNQYWISLDGTFWTKLSLSGDTWAVTGAATMPFLMRDGVLFRGDAAIRTSWFGSAGRQR